MNARGPMGLPRDIQVQNLWTCHYTLIRKYNRTLCGFKKKFNIIFFILYLIKLIKKMNEFFLRWDNLIKNKKNY